ncbi:hypothetical protein [Alkalimarinus alittae]|uniref:Dolichyl-phosphate-mannose--protein mannosyltransferase n=1 Tax=Alkalimarinus alittae TaxID=2961619 RepID=A0ABY6MZI2_9ALTE|nr:hypothetical protein [Alkalimarinus alittae]UZE95164.1 hypothetical protein NKI27_13955 [Alkalimarinus alittae]
MILVTCHLVVIDKTLSMVVGLVKNRDFVSVFLLLVLTVVVFSSGLYGRFILDDIINLQGISRINEGEGVTAWLSYIFGGVGASGRPVSYFSFALQSSSWPGSPYNFKVINLMLHVVNGALVYWLSRLLLNFYYNNDDACSSKNIFGSHGLAITVATFWLLSPIQVSTVLYIVQRMSILSAMFVLIGLIFWMVGRAKDASLTRKIVCLVFGYGGAFVFAVLSKENGVLLPLYVLILEAISGQANVKCRLYRLWKWLFVYVPLVMVASYFIWNAELLFVRSYSARPFTLIERLLTEPLILFDYISKILFPSNGRYSLFHENYPIATVAGGLYLGLLALTALLGAIIWAAANRTKYLWSALGILIYFSAHSLESTIIPLELYFEHRNYFALLGVVAVFVSCLVWGVKNIGVPNHYKLNVLATLVTLCATWLAFLTFNEAKVWSRPLLQASNWYESNPTSQRAHGHLGATLFKYGAYEQSSQFYQDTLHLFTNDPTKPLLWLELSCLSSQIELPSQAFLREVAKTGKFYKETFNIIHSTIALIESGQCVSLDKTILKTYISDLIGNTNYSGNKFELFILLSKIFGVEGDYYWSILYMEIAKDFSPRVDVLVSLSNMYWLYGDYNKSKKYMELVAERCNKLSIECLKYKPDVDDLMSLKEKIKQHE